MRTFLTILASVLVIVSCNPYRFTLIYNMQYELIEGQILSHFDNFEKLDDNSFSLTQGGIASIRKQKLTNYQFETNLSCSKELQLNLWFRTLTNQFDRNTGIRLELQNDELKVFDNSKQIYSEKIFFADINNTMRSIYFKLINEGNNYFITFDCHPQIVLKTDLALSEYIIIENLSDENLIVKGIKLQESQKK